MRPPQYSTTPLAAVFVDYENLHRLLSQRVDACGDANGLIAELIDEVRRHLETKERTTAALTHAYANFSAFEGDGPFIQRSLYLQEVEPRYVPGTLQANAAELQLCIDALEVLHQRPDIETIVLLTGDRAYLPLVQQCRRYGRRVLVAALERPVALDHGRYAESEVFLDALTLLGDTSRLPVKPRRVPAPAPEAPAPEAPPAPTLAFVSIDDPVLLQTLEIIDECFGQYDEVYLTPLLRKLSELFDDEAYDPKVVISDLEKTGAVRLEKRRGFPYDYTVLLVEATHPDVARIQAASAGRTDLAERDEDDYDDYEDGYDDDFVDDFVDDYDGTPALPGTSGDGVDGDGYDEPDWDDRLS